MQIKLILVFDKILFVCKNFSILVTNSINAKIAGEFSSTTKIHCDKRAIITQKVFENV